LEHQKTKQQAQTPIDIIIICSTKLKVTLKLHNNVQKGKESKI
jgi:hypothetical protein